MLDRQEDKTDLTWWFPKIEAAGLPVPRTSIVEMPEIAQKAIWAAFDGSDEGNAKPFFEDIERIATALGFPCFLRTSHTSSKHNWERTCYLDSPDAIPDHVFQICEYSEICGMFGDLPWHTWVVREMLPTLPLGVCENFGNMPVCREFRFFVSGGEVKCFHPYWPMKALDQGHAVSGDGSDRASLYERLCECPDETALREIASNAGKAVGGDWSIDLLETEQGWFVTDMAEAHKSFHWEDCSANI